KKPEHKCRDHINFLVQRETAGVQEMNFRIGDGASEGQGTRDSKKRIVLTPHNERWWMVLAQVCLPIRICCRIRAIVEHEIELDSMHPWFHQKREFVCPSVGVDSLGVRNTGRMALTRHFDRKQSLA